MAGPGYLYPGSPVRPAGGTIGITAVIVAAIGTSMNCLSVVGLLGLGIMVGEAANDDQFIGVVIFGIVFFVLNVVAVAAGMVLACVGLGARSPRKGAVITALVLSIGNILALALIGLMFIPVASGVLSGGA